MSKGFTVRELYLQSSLIYLRGDIQSKTAAVSTAHWNNSPAGQFSFFIVEFMYSTISRFQTSKIRVEK